MQLYSYFMYVGPFCLMYAYILVTVMSKQLDIALASGLHNLTGILLINQPTLH